MNSSLLSPMNFEKTVDEDDRQAFTFDSAVLSGTVDIASDELVVYSENKREHLTIRVGQHKGETTLVLTMNQEAVFTGTLTELVIKLQAADALTALRNYLNLPAGKPLNNL